MNYQCKIFYFCLALIYNCHIPVSCVNVTVVYLTEESVEGGFVFIAGVKKTSGLVDRAISKAKEIVGDSVNLNFIINPVPIFTCTSLQFGAIISELYYKNDIHAIVGPGWYYTIKVLALHETLIRLLFVSVISGTRYRVIVTGPL